MDCPVHIISDKELHVLLVINLPPSGFLIGKPIKCCKPTGAGLILRDPANLTKNTPQVSRTDLAIKRWFIIGQDINV